MKLFTKIMNFDKFDKDEVNTLEYENSFILLISISICFFIAFLNYVYFNFVHVVENNNVAENSLIFLFFGTLFYIYKIFNFPSKIKNILISLTSNIIMIYLVIFYYPLIGPTVWTYTFIIILLALIRKNKIDLVILSLTIFMLGLYILISNIEYMMDSRYYLSQFIAFSIMLPTSWLIIVNNNRKNNKIESQIEILNKVNKNLEKTNNSLEKAIDAHLNTIILLDESEKKFKSIVSALPDIIFKMNIEGEFIECEGNENFWQLYPIDKIIGNNVINLLPENIAQMTLSKIKMTLETKTIQKLEYQLNEDSLNDYYEARFIPADSDLCYCIIRNISETKNKQKTIEYLSFHDQLTGVFNRRFFEEELKRIDIKRNYPLTIVMIDINGLKMTNDAFGHLAGDELLKKVAEILVTECRSDEIIARIGGDEFILLLPKTTSNQAEVISERIYKAIAKEKINNIDVSVSIGWGVKISDKQNIDDIFIKAEETMYHKKLIENQSLRFEFIRNILEQLNEKNEREKIHSEKVSKISKIIGEELGLDYTTLKEIEISGLMHDIGKISVSNSILDKKGELSELEYEKVKHHPESGYHLLKSVNAYSVLAEYVLYHHERWDGKGYPRGLKGEEIPLVSRILAVADSYEAMISDRPYRESLSSEEALLELKKNAGTQFDESLIKIFENKVFKKLNN
ncbi:MAG: diguanylate cyclase [Firmicutes bacterium]|nr:diguanylate cyclase [Bacillota bacterium]